MSGKPEWKRSPAGIRFCTTKRQKEHTYFLKAGYVFHNPPTGAEWKNIEHQRRSRKQTLKRTDLRYREPYQTRYTFASQARACR